MTQSRIVVSLVGFAALVGITLVCGYSLLDLFFGMCGGDGGFPNVPHESEAGRFCESWHFSAYLLAQFAVPTLCVIAGTVWAMVRGTEGAIVVGIAAAVLLLLAAPSYPASLSTECDYPVQNSEQCATY
jgi:hypothetical protein